MGSRFINKNITISSGIMKWVRGSYPSLKPKERTAVVVVVENALSIGKKGCITYKRRKEGLEPERYNVYRLPNQYLAKAVDLLVSSGYVLSTVGEYHGDEDMTQSTFWPTDLLLYLFPASEVEYIKDQDRKTSTKIALRDNEKNLSDYKDNRKTVNMERQVGITNKINGMFAYAHITGSYVNDRLVRIFNESFDKGGRFYRSDIHQIKQRDKEGNKLSIEQTRLGLKICEKGREEENDSWSNVVELDYGALHVILIACMHNMDISRYSGDIYSEMLPDNYIEQDRNLFKIALLIMINSRSRRSAMGAIRDTINNGFYSFKNASDVMDRIIDSLPEFEDFFFRSDSYGLTLQNVDSNIMERILKHFSDAGKPCIPVHDSIVVRAEDEEFAFDAMYNSFKDEMKKYGCYSPVFSIVIKRWDGSSSRYKCGTEYKPLSAIV